MAVSLSNSEVTLTEGLLGNMETENGGGDAGGGGCAGGIGGTKWLG